MYMEYETPRMYLRVLKPEYAPQVLNFYERDRALFEKYEPTREPNFYTVPYQHTLLRAEYNLAIRKESIRFYCFRKENPNEIIGTICFHDICYHYSKSTELGYKFSSQYHQMGYATEAIQKGIEIMFRDLGLHRIEAYVLEGNTPSMKLLDNLGFEKEGLCRSNLLIQGNWRSHYLYSLISNLDT